MSVPTHLQQHPMFSGARFGIMSADAPRFTPMLEGHENLVRTLKDMDLDHIQTHGKWSGVPERSVIIKNPTREQMENLGRTFGQEAVVFSEDQRHQLIHTNGPDAGKTLGAKLDGNPVDFFTDPPDDNYTHLPGHGYFRINFDFNGTPESPMVQPMVKSGQNPATSGQPLEKRSKNVRNWTRYEQGGAVIPAGETREAGGSMTYYRDTKRPLSDETKERRARSLLQKLGIVAQSPGKGFTPIRADEQGRAVVTPAENRTTALHEAGHILAMPKGRTLDEHQQWMTGSFKQQQGAHAIDEIAADKISAGLARRAGIAPKQDDNYATVMVRNVEQDLKKPKLPKTESKYRQSTWGPGKVVREDYSNLKTNMTDHPQKQMYVAGLHNPVEYAKAKAVAAKRIQAVDEGRLSVKEGKLSFAQRSPILRRSKMKKAEAYTDAQGNTQWTGAPRTGGTIAPPKLTTFGQYAQSKGLGGHISQQTPGAITVDKTVTSPGTVKEPTVNWRSRSPVMKRSSTGLTKSDDAGQTFEGKKHASRLLLRAYREVADCLRSGQHLKQTLEGTGICSNCKWSRLIKTPLVGGGETTPPKQGHLSIVKSEQVSGVRMHPHAYPWHDWNDQGLEKNSQDTPESLAAWEKWKQDQTKYSPDEQVWQDHMADIGTRTEHGKDNPAAQIQGNTGGTFMTHGANEAHWQNMQQAQQFGFSRPTEPADFTQSHFGPGYGPILDRDFWQDVAQRSPLLRRSRNKLIHKAEAPIVNDQHAPQGTSEHYRRLSAPYGNIAPVGQPGSTVKHYPLEGRHMAVDKMLHDHGYAHYYAGGKYGKPDLAKKNYETGHLMIYDPEPGLGGDFGTRQYTDTWRKSHELAHALTLKEVNGVYGEGRRMGKLGTHRSLNEAMRAVHWEWLAAHKQRELLAGVGVNVPDETFHKELNTVMHDAVHRAVTGKFTDPEMERFIPHGYKIPLSVSLDQLRNEAEKLGLQKADPWKSNAELMAHLNTKGEVHGVMRDVLLESGAEEKVHRTSHPLKRMKAGLGMVPKEKGPSSNMYTVHETMRLIREANAANRITGTNASEPTKVHHLGEGVAGYERSIRDSLFWEDVDKDPNPYSDAQLETIPEEVRARSPILSRSRFTKAEGRFQAAFRDLKTGKITPTRYYHEAAELPGWHEGMSDEEVENKWESGWIDSKGKWFTRVQAAKAAGHPEPLDSTNYGYGQSEEDPKFVSARSPILKRSKKSRT